MLGGEDDSAVLYKAVVGTLPFSLAAGLVVAIFVYAVGVPVLDASKDSVYPITVISFLTVTGGCFRLIWQQFTAPVATDSSADPDAED